MRVGVVVPNYNGAAFLKECIDSILSQDHADIRCLVMDGASSDASLEILHTYGDRIEVVSERDGGQADAIQRGFSRLDTELVGWLNSDDVLMPGAISAAARAAEQNPSAVLFHGNVELVNARGEHLRDSRAQHIDYEKMRSGRGKTLQPGSFYRKAAVDAAGGVDASFHLLMDVDLWIRLLKQGPAVEIDSTLAKFRIHPAAKSSQAPYRYYRETLRLGLKHESDRLVRAVTRRSLRIARYHFTHLLGLSSSEDRLQLNVARRVLADIWEHPNNSGRRMRALSRFAAWQAYKRLTDRSLALEIFPGVRMRCHPDSSSVAAQIYSHGAADFAEMSFLRHYLRAGDRFLDVGANEGVYAMLAANIVTPNGEVHAFEPVPVTAGRLAENARLNGFRHVHLHECAVGAEPGSVRFSTNRGAMNHIELNSGTENTIDVPVTTLDDEVRGEFALGKMDVEGAELFALRGARTSLANSNPPAWILELNGMCERFGFACEDVASALRDSGFELYLYDPATRTLTTRREPWKESPNIIAIANSRLSSVKERLRSTSR